MKTITELNEKWWYRFIKVIFFFLFTFFLVISVVTPYIIFSDATKKVVYCANGKILTEDVLRYSDIRLNSHDSFVSVDDTTNIRGLCVPESKYISKIQMQKIFDERPAGVNIDKLLSKFIENGWVVEGVNTETSKIYREYTADDLNKINFEIKKDTEWLEMLGTILGSFLGTIIIFEILKRVFYYIILGKIKPIK